MEESMNRTVPLLLFLLCALFGLYIFFDTLDLVATLPQDALTNRFVATAFVWAIGLCFGGLSTVNINANPPVLCRCK